MKKITQYIATLCIGGALLSSCDSFLDIKPVGKVIPTSLQDYRNLMNQAYQIPIYDRGVCDLRTTDLVIKDDRYEQGVYADIETWNENAKKSGSTYNFAWATYYSAIYYANAIIAQENQMTEGKSAEIEQLVGEAYLLRGYLHFILVNLYGEPYTKAQGPQSKAIPIKHSLDLEGTPTRNTVEEVYQAVLNDIEEARKRITQEQWEERYLYRFNTLAVDALASRVHLYMGDWEKAYAAAKRVLDKKSSLEDLNLADSKLPNHFQSVEIINAYEQVMSSSVRKASWATDAALQAYTANDLRASRFFDPRDAQGNLPIAKIASDKTGDFHCSFRTGEVYLNAAEAAVQSNKLAEGRSYLLHLMKNRYTPAGYTQKTQAINAMSKEQLAEEVLKERARELIYEGHRWFDLRRTSRPALTKVLKGKTYTLQANDPRYTLQIPTEATDANPGLLSK